MTEMDIGDIPVLCFGSLLCPSYLALYLVIFLSLDDSTLGTKMTRKKLMKKWSMLCFPFVVAKENDESGTSYSTTFRAAEALQRSAA